MLYTLNLQYYMTNSFNFLKNQAHSKQKKGNSESKSST